MNKKILIALTIIILLTASLAGCFGGSESKDTSEPSYTEETAEYPPETGWLESGTQEAREDEQIYVEVDSEISIILNNSNVFSASIELMFSDYDEAHAGSDGNSPADEVEVTLTNAGFNESASGTTPCTLRFEMMGNQTEGDMQESLPSELTFHVYAKCFCEITWPMTGRPNLMNLYVRDNGVAYEFSAGYQYYQEVE